MRVAIDSWPLVSGHRWRGVGSYTRNLLEQLPAAASFVFQENKEKLKDYDLLHYPYFDLFFPTLPLKKIAKTVVTIYDVIPLFFPHEFPVGVKGKINFWRQKLALRSVAAVITDSQSSKKDIVKYLAYPEDKITVVYLAPGKIFRPVKKDTQILRKYNLPKDFILYVGDVNYHKNVFRLVQAVKNLGLTLVIVGKQAKPEKLIDHPETRALNTLIKEYGEDQGVKRLGFVPEEELVQLYNQATLYCQPSLYEGFGLPVLEAMACSCPVACSRNSSLPEIGGEAAVYFEPGKVKSIAAGIRAAMNEREKLSQLGLEQAKKFSWEKTAQETWSVYEKIAGEK
jgi:glycosyltransferase involved in cell wall biosynthesis